MTITNQGKTNATESFAELAIAIQGLANEWATQREERQKRRSLEQDDFIQLREIGYLLVGIPEDLGGLWIDAPHSTREVTDILRVLAKADPSVSLVCAMHPAVLQANGEARGTGNEAWEEQRRWIFETVHEGAFWGTVVSEPGSGGDVRRTKSEVRRTSDGRYLLSGLKHFGSGSGITSFMVTTGRLEGRDKAEPDSFFLDVRDVPWDGSTGMQLVSAWDGHGMCATQSHSFQFSDFPAIHSLRPSGFELGFFPCACSGIILGILEEALQEARARLSSRVDSLAGYEETEWTSAELEYWLAEQALEGMLRSLEQESPGRAADILKGKTAVAQLAETAMTRLCRIMGGSSYGRSSPFGFWFEDVRALGFLRPPWLMAYGNMAATLRAEIGLVNT